ncbi:MAG: MMPL family transporter [Candidatus Heimdallarchaeota archaeon]|nr:MMPL family transporter [Candidatus Heimdallarchaeota archaeon]
MVSLCILIFWVLIVSINLNKVLNINEFVADESNSLISSGDIKEADQGADIIGQFSEDNSSFQIIIHNPNGTILSDEMRGTITQIINDITSNPKIGPYLSSKLPYSSLFDDADNMLRTIFSLQWFATQLSFASVHYVWGGIDHFSSIWLDRYNLSTDVNIATDTTVTLTKNYLESLLDTYNESRYLLNSYAFFDLLAESFKVSANVSLPVSSADVLNLCKEIVIANSTLFESYIDDERYFQLLKAISEDFNETMWEDNDYIFQQITKFLFNTSDTFSVEFVREVYDNGDIEGFVEAKNKYLMDVLKREVVIPPISLGIVETYLKQYTNYKNDSTVIDTTFITFRMSLSHRNEIGKEAYYELLEFMEVLQENYSDLKLFVTGINLFIIELSLDYLLQLQKTDIIIIITIIVILILVYRSPILPLIQIFVLAIAFSISRLLFILVGNMVGGLSSTSLLLLSVSVLGASTDYCVFLMGDYLIHIKQGKNRLEALKKTLKRTSKSIVISSISLTVGFGSFILSRYSIMTGMGFGGAIGFFVSMVVSLTVIPAILLLINPKILTKWKIPIRKIKKPKFSVISGVKKAVRNPGKVFAIALVLAIVGTGVFLLIPTDYAQISTAPQSYQSRQGLDALNYYMGAEFTSQIIILFQTPENESFIQEDLTLNYESINLVLELVETVLSEIDFSRVMGLSHPLGEPYTTSIENSSYFLTEEIQILMKNFVLPEAILGTVILGSKFEEGDKRLDVQIEYARELIKEQKIENGIEDWNIYLTGFAPILYDSKVGITEDFVLILGIASTAIFVLLFIFMKNFFMALRVLITILISLGISLGILGVISYFFLGGAIYWIVPLLLYTILTALGLDFDVLFLGIFNDLNEKDKDTKKNIVDAVDQTMNNISVAGIVMAATYLTLVFTSSINMQQIGLGLGIGILIDVFVSRLFIVPPAIAITVSINIFKRKKKKNDKGKDEKNDEK